MSLNVASAIADDVESDGSEEAEMSRSWRHARQVTWSLEYLQLEPLL